MEETLPRDSGLGLRMARPAQRRRTGLAVALLTTTVAPFVPGASAFAPNCLSSAFAESAAFCAASGRAPRRISRIDRLALTASGNGQDNGRGTRDGDNEDAVDPDAAWLNARPYDAGVKREVGGSGPIVGGGDRERGDYSWLNSGSLFDQRKMPATARDRIREQEFQAVNAFSNETAFKGAIVGCVLLFAFYTSVFLSGGIDGSNRVTPDGLANEACTLESDPNCRY